MEPRRRASLTELAALFVRLGLTAFGGPAAHVAMMEDEVVTRRAWMTRERFLDLFGAANLIPGPSSSELAIFIGYEEGGVLGLLVAGACFILPAALLTGTIGWAYVRYGALPRAGGVLYGVKPVVIAIVVQAIWGLAPKAIKKSWWLGALGAGAVVASVLGVNAMAVLLGAGALAGARRLLERSPSVPVVPLVPLFLVFLKLGAVVFGSGYVLLAFLRADLVERLHWMTEAQLIDAVAVGQVTPGPVFTTATFIGYVLAGAPGAVVATIGIFLPGFLLVAAIRPLLTKMRKSPTMGAFLDGVNVASLGLMLAVLLPLAHAALVDAMTVAIALGGAALLLRFKVSSTWLIAGGALLGLLTKW